LLGFLPTNGPEHVSGFHNYLIFKKPTNEIGEKTLSPLLPPCLPVPRLKIQKTEKGKAAPLPPHSNLKENTQFVFPSGFFLSHFTSLSVWQLRKFNQD